MLRGIKMFLKFNNFWESTGKICIRKQECFRFEACRCLNYDTCMSLLQNACINVPKTTGILGKPECFLKPKKENTRLVNQPLFQNACVPQNRQISKQLGKNNQGLSKKCENIKGFMTQQRGRP